MALPLLPHILSCYAEKKRGRLPQPAPADVLRRRRAIQPIGCPARDKFVTRRERTEGRDVKLVYHNLSPGLTSLRRNAHAKTLRAEHPSHDALRIAQSFLDAILRRPASG